MLSAKRLYKRLDQQLEQIVGNAQRQAINTPIQGSCGQLTAFSIGILRHRLDPRVKFVNTVHDSIIYYVPNDILHEQIDIMVKTCEDLPISTYFKRNLNEGGKLGVKMKVDVEFSTTRWSELKDYEKPKPMEA